MVYQLLLGNTSVVPVGQDCEGHILWVSVVRQDLDAVSRMIHGRRTDLSIEIVEQAGNTSVLFGFTELSGVASH